MAYRKTGYRKRGYRKRASMYKKQPVWKRMVGIGKELYTSYNKGPLGYALKQLSYIRGLINSETKYHDTNTSVAPTSGAASVTNMTLCAQGDTIDNRNGNSVLAKYLVLRLNYVMNTLDTTVNIRCVIFVDKENANGTAPVIGDIIQGGLYNGPINKVNGKRFAVLRDWSIVLNTGGNASKTDKIYIPLKGLHVKYDGTTAAQGDASENHCYLAFVTNSGNASAVDFFTRFGFHDN